MHGCAYSETLPSNVPAHVEINGLLGLQHVLLMRYQLCDTTDLFICAPKWLKSKVHLRIVGRQQTERFNEAAKNHNSPKKIKNK